MKSAPDYPWIPEERDAFGLLVLVLFGFTLWDFYIQGVGIRPFDILTTLAITVAGIVGIAGGFALDAAGGRRIATVWGLVVFYALVGILSDADNARPVLGFLTGGIVFAGGSMIPVPTRRVFVAATAVCIVIHVLAFWLQMLIFDITGFLINYHAWLGGEPRVFGKQFRACGLLLEPAHFAVTMFLLVILRVRMTQRIDRIVVLAILTSVISLSLWGIGAFLLLVVAKTWRTRGLWICALVGIVAALIALPSLDSWSRSFWLARRVMTIGSDSGASVRYGVLITTVSGSLWEPTTWFGIGITDDYTRYGVSGLGFLARAFGLFGLAGYLLGMFLSAPRGQKTFTLAATAMALTATSMWTYMLWWFWLALMLRMFHWSEDWQISPLGSLARVPGPLGNAAQSQ